MQIHQQVLFRLWPSFLGCIIYLING